MDGPGINQKIRFGYAKAAQKLGQPFQLYRSATSFNPINDSNLIGLIKCVATIDWKWMKSNRPGNAIFWLLVDGQSSSYPLSAQEGDYLVGEETYFVLTKEYQMPMSGVQCNVIASIIRPKSAAGIGDQGYSYYPNIEDVPIMELMPISILKDKSGQPSPNKLPTDTSQPGWLALLPNLGDIKIKTGDILKDNDGSDYVIGVNEKTEFGWRLTCQQVVNN